MIKAEIDSLLSIANVLKSCLKAIQVIDRELLACEYLNDTIELIEEDVKIDKMTSKEKLAYLLRSIE